MIISFAVLVETILHTSIRGLLLLPTAVLVVIGLIASFLIDFYHTVLFTNYLEFLIISALFFLGYSVVWGVCLIKGV